MSLHLQPDILGIGQHKQHSFATGYKAWTEHYEQPAKSKVSFCVEHVDSRFPSPQNDFYQDLDTQAVLASQY